ncbi:MAG: NAD(P)H-quinone oxidoreductase [Pseudomonadota bacterium]
MRAVTVAAPGGPDSLVVSELDTPTPQADEVLIEVAASGVNRADILQRQGFYPSPPGAPDWPGLEVSGRIAAIGKSVDRWRQGDAVCALLPGGGYAEYVCVAASCCLPVPAELSVIHAAALPETVLTVWSNLMDRAAVQPGETALIHGGSSGIGTTAIQILSAFGCTVYCTAGSAEKQQACEALGAARCINYRDQDFVDELREETDGRGVDVILDMVGGDYINRNIDIAAVEGRIVNIAYQAGAQVEVNLLPVMLKRLTLTGSTLRARDAAYKAALVQTVRERAWPWLHSGALRPVVHATFSPSEAGEAHRVMESSKHIGKLLLDWTRI